MKSHNADAEDPALKLQHDYKDVLRRRITELHVFSGRCREGKLTFGEIEDIHLRVRSLVGSGATYGHPNVSAAADPLDQALESPSTFGVKALAALAEDLVRACEESLVKEIDVGKSGNILIFKPPPPQPGGAKPLLLIVDDDPAIHDLVRAMFKNTSQIISAYNGAEAISAVQHHFPDMILLDNYMPGAGGLKLLEQLSSEKNSAATPVIMLTADSGPNEIMRAASVGVADYVIKPFEPRVLADKIHAVMRRMQMSVLVAHGDKMMRELIAGRLRRTGLTVLEAASGRDALTLATAKIPELILLDQAMPGMEGGCILHNLRNDRPTRHIPILYLAADRHGHASIENLDTGATEPIAFPSPPEKVAARVIDALGFENAVS